MFPAWFGGRASPGGPAGPGKVPFTLSGGPSLAILWPGGSMGQFSTESLKVFDLLLKYLTEDGWTPQKLEDKFILRMGFKGRNGHFTCFAQIAGEYDQFIFYACSPLATPEDKRLEIAEYLIRANYGMRIGNFEMDMSDGEIRYKSSFDFEGFEPPNILFRNSIYPAVNMMDKYLPGIMAVLSGAKTPEEAIKMVEG